MAQESGEGSPYCSRQHAGLWAWPACRSPPGPSRHSPGAAHHLNRVRLTGKQTNLGGQGPAGNSQVPGRPAGQPSAGTGLAGTGALTHLCLNRSKELGLAQAHPPTKHPSRGDSLSVSSRVRSQAKYGAPDIRCLSKQIFLEKTIWQRMSRASSVARGSVVLLQANVRNGNASIPAL